MNTFISTLILRRLLHVVSCLNHLPMKKYILTVLLIRAALPGFSQQSSISTMFWNNYSILNPAASGLYYKYRGSVHYRNQWDKVNGAPNTLSASYDMKIDSWRSGIGVNYVLDAIGFAREHRINLNYSYYWKIGETGILSTGISVGILNLSPSGNWASPTAVNDPTLSSWRGTGLAINAGVIYKNRNFSAGFSVTELNEPDINSYSTPRHYNLCADYVIDLSDKLYLKPQGMFRTDAVKYAADVNLLIYYNKQFWAGMSYRTSDAVAWMAGVDIFEKFRVGYSYDLTINQLSSISRGTHEAVLAFMLR